MQKVEVPGVGPVEFPDGMTDEQMSAAIKQNYPQLQKGPSNEPPISKPVAQPAPRPPAVGPVASPPSLPAPAPNPGQPSVRMVQPQPVPRPGPAPAQAPAAIPSPPPVAAQVAPRAQPAPPVSVGPAPVRQPIAGPVPANAGVAPQHWWERAVPREPGYEYGDILPFRRKPGGPTEWSPEYSNLVKGVSDLFTGPGRAFRGEEINPEETVSDAMLLVGGNRPPVAAIKLPPKPAVSAVEARVEPTVGAVEGAQPVAAKPVAEPVPAAKPGELPAVEGLTEPTLGPEVKIEDRPSRAAVKPNAAVSKSAINYNKDTLLTAIKKLGGMNVEHALDISGEKGFRASSGNAGLWKKNGKGIDDMVQQLADEGYIPAAALREADGGVQWLRDAVRDEIDGDKIYSSRADESVIFGKMRDQYDEKMYLGSGPFLPPGAMKRAMTAMFGEPTDNMKAFDPLIEAEQTGVARADRIAARLGNRVRTLLPEKKDREAVTAAIVRGNLDTLTPEQKTAAQFIQRVYQQVGEYAVENEAISGLRKNYQPQRWDTSDPQTLAILNEWKKAKAQRNGTVEPSSMLGQLLESKGFGTGSKSPFLMQRVISDVFEGMKLGLKPASMDSAALLETYIPSVARTIYRNKTMDGLASLTGDDGNFLMLPHDKAPAGYVKIDAPDLEGMRVSPEIAPAVRVLMETKDPGLTARAAQTISYIGKRAATMYSGFHMGSLYTSWVGNGGNPFTPRAAAKSALDAYRSGGQGDVIDKFLKGGLTLGAPLEDVMARERAGAVGQAVERTVDKVLPSMLKGKAGDFDRWLQTATFDRVQTGFKLDMAMREYQREMTKNLTREKPLTEKQIVEQVAKSVNNMQGGQNWERAVTSLNTPFMRDAMSRIYSPSGKRVMQTALFAPDWLKSTIQSWTDAVLPGEPEAVRRGIAQRYLARSLAYQQVLGNALQMSIDGRLMVDNEPTDGSRDWTKRFIAKNTVHLKNGQELDLSKHFMEVPHALADPKKFAVNKLGIIPLEGVAQLENKQYPVWPDWQHMSAINPPNITTPGDFNAEALARRLGHAAGSFIPIPAQQVISGNPLQAAAGMAGASVRGMADEDKEGRAARKMRERQLKREQREAR